MAKQVEKEGREIIQHLRAELEFGERMIQKHRADGHLVAAEQREKYCENLRRWLAWLER